MIVVGSTPVITTTFRDEDGNLADPNTVSADIRAPDGTMSSPTPTNVSVGIWETLVPVDQAGWWFYEIAGSGGGVDVVDQGSFCVAPSLVSV